MIGIRCLASTAVDLDDSGGSRVATLYEAPVVKKTDVVTRWREGAFLTPI
jgi:hypothetical protein